MEAWPCLLCKEVYAPKLGRLIGPVFLIDSFNQIHVLFGKLEVENLEVLLQSLDFRRLWNDNRVPLNAPAEDDLGHSPVVFLSKILTKNWKPRLLANNIGK